VTPTTHDFALLKRTHNGFGWLLFSDGGLSTSDIPPQKPEQHGIILGVACVKAWRRTTSLLKQEPGREQKVDRFAYQLPGRRMGLPAAPFLRLPRNRGRDLLDHIRQRQAGSIVLDGRERVRETERSRIGYEREELSVGLGPLEQCGNRNAKDGRGFDEASH
jgi:hypothetical protein